MGDDNLVTSATFAQEETLLAQVGFFYGMASKPINIRRIRAGFKPFFKITYRIE